MWSTPIGERAGEKRSERKGGRERKCERKKEREHFACTVSDNTVSVSLSRDENKGSRCFGKTKD